MNTNNRHLVRKLRTKLDSASTVKLCRQQAIYRNTNVFSLVSRLLEYVYSILGHNNNCTLTHGRCAGRYFGAGPLSIPYLPLRPLVPSATILNSLSTPFITPFWICRLSLIYMFLAFSDISHQVGKVARVAKLVRICLTR